MSDAILVGISIVLMTLVPFDLYVARTFVSAALIKPRGVVGNFVAFQVSAVAAAAVLVAALGVHSVVFLASSGTVRLIPQPFPVLILVLAVVVMSLPNIYGFRRLREWADEERRARIHRRNGDVPRFHRRRDDRPPGAPPNG